ncbi:MAG TPA: 16S rRNA processing protein RimM, partial [Firmicutes bacterium]|nr:16S rRNA processing protein RimM [Bacillota bacterium]
MKREDFVSVGLIVGTFGKAGELKVKLLSDSPDILNEVPRVVIEQEGRITPIDIEYAKIHKGLLIVKVKSCNSITEGLQFKGGFLSIYKDERPHPGEDEYYADELIGLKVFTLSGRSLGTVRELYSV